MASIGRMAEPRAALGYWQRSTSRERPLSKRFQLSVPLFSVTAPKRSFDRKLIVRTLDSAGRFLRIQASISSVLRVSDRTVEADCSARIDARIRQRVLATVLLRRLLSTGPATILHEHLQHAAADV